MGRGRGELGRRAGPERWAEGEHEHGQEHGHEHGHEHEHEHEGGHEHGQEDERGRGQQGICEELVVMATEDQKRIEEFRGYLHALARLQLSARPWLAGKLDSSDLVQKTFVRAYEHCEQYRGGSDAELAGWLRQILNRVLANELRHWGQARRNVGAEQSLEQELDASGYRLDQMLQADQTSVSQRVQRGERAERLAEAIECLPEEQRVVVLARHCRGLGLQEIAEETGRTAASVAGLLRRGLATLREQLGEELS